MQGVGSLLPWPIFHITKSFHTKGRHRFLDRFQILGNIYIVWHQVVLEFESSRFQKYTAALTIENSNYSYLREPDCQLNELPMENLYEIMIEAKQKI